MTIGNIYTSLTIENKLYGFCIVVAQSMKFIIFINTKINQFRYFIPSLKSNVIFYIDLQIQTSSSLLLLMPNILFLSMLVLPIPIAKIKIDNMIKAVCYTVSQVDSLVEQLNNLINTKQDAITTKLETALIYYFHRLFYLK